MLEIGSWEGRSALFFLNYLRASHLVCVDTFGGNVEHMRNPHFAALVPETERQFDANVAAFGTRVEKIKGPSGAVLPQLGIQSRRFDLVYVDGSHLAADVYSDGALTWPMVSRGGIVIFDDYEFDEIKEESERPKLGIDAFLTAFDGQYRVVHQGLSGRDRQAVSCRASSACSAASGVNLDLPTKRAPLFKLCRGGTPTRGPAGQAHAADRLRSSAAATSITL